ncbi:type IV pilus twitching motility protein PilT [Candidatus Saganbacteria bacterium]|nr:type IV pilus twitching motility protein PilT [Candidatus Saganbacteria bacterium]
MEMKDLLARMSEQNASDLLLTVDLPPILRIAGQLVKTSLPVLDAAEVKRLCCSLLTEEQVKRFEKERELDFSSELKDSRFRINYHFSRDAVGAAIRRIPRVVPTREELRLPKVVEYFCNLPRGLVLVTGPTGCGKSTTQAAMIDIINTTRGTHIITVEDPIEYVHSHKKSIIEQREVGSDTLSFPEALKRVLRMNPDVILVGEMRDLETIQTALTAAETGHLVISTLHTPDAPQAVDRIVDVFPPYQQSQIRIQLSMTLQGVIAQQLLTRKDGKGVVPAIEILVATPAVRNIVRKANTPELYTVVEMGGQYGMQKMDASLKELYDNNLISLSDALSKASNREQLEKVLKPSTM